MGANWHYVLSAANLSCQVQSVLSLYRSVSTCGPGRGSFASEMRDHVIPLHRHVEVSDEPIVVLKGEEGLINSSPPKKTQHRKKRRKKRATGVTRKQIVLSATQVLCLNFFKQNSCIKYCYKLLFRDTTIRWLYRKLIVSVHLYSGLKQKETIIFGFRLLRYVFYAFTCRSHSAPLLGSCRNRFKNQVWMLLFALLIFPGTLTGAWTLGWRGQKCVL